MKKVLILFLFLPQICKAGGFPCTFTFDKYPKLCVEIRHLGGNSKNNSFWKYDAIQKKDVVRAVEKNVQTAGGEIYFYIWQKDRDKAPRNISGEYDISASVVMPNMYSGPCISGKFYAEEWRSMDNGSYFVGKTYVMSGINNDTGKGTSGLYRISLKARKKGDTGAYSELKRLLPVFHDDPVLLDPQYDDWVGRFTYQFSVPFKN